MAQLRFNIEVIAKLCKFDLNVFQAGKSQWKFYNKANSRFNAQFIVSTSESSTRSFSSV